MYFRCGKCHASIWVQPQQQSRGALNARCENCGHKHELDRSSALNSRDLYDRAGLYARDKGIDVPAAFSVFLGIMSIEEVLAVGTRTNNDPPAAGKPAKRERLKYDPEFGPAVEAGRLTPMQALQRGQRDQYASRMASRHRLPIALAYQVADNRISLLTATRKRKSALPISNRVRPNGSRWRRYTAVGAVLSVVLSALIVLRVADGVNPHAEEVGRVEARVVTDDLGRVTQVVGSDPQEVLVAFGRSDRALEAVGLMPSSLPSPRLRVGLLRENKDDPESNILRAIPIRRDRADTSWIAGDGTTPLVAARTLDVAGRTVAIQ